MGLGYLLLSLGPCLDLVILVLASPRAGSSDLQREGLGYMWRNDQGPPPCALPGTPPSRDSCTGLGNSVLKDIGGREGSEDGDWLLIKKQVMCRSCFIPIRTIKGINYQIWR